MKNKLFSNIKTLTSIFSIAILVVTIVMLILRITVFSPTKNQTKQVETPETNGTENIDTGSEGVDDFTFSINGNIIFKDFNATANPQIENSASNSYLMQVKIIRDDNKTLVYSSDYIKPGFNTRTMKLEGQPMEAGEYPCTAEIIIMDIESMEVIETLTKPVTVTIESSLPDERD